MRTDVLLDRAPKARDSKIIVSSTQDVEPILENNALLRSQPQRSDWAREIAEIPNVILVQWANESGLRPFTPEFNRLVRRKLEDPDWKHLRVDR
jgi:hypothetical protein